jgi:hypothetical protein
MIDLLASDPNLGDFHELPGTLYRDDPNYVREPCAKIRASLLRERFADRQQAFLWRSGNRALARVVARVSPALTDEDAAPIGMLGFFEAFDAPDEVVQLLSTTIGWLKDQGANTIIGPMDGDTWHRYRFNVGPFDQPPFLMEPYNKPYYGELWQQAGFQALENYYSKVVDDAEAAATPLAKVRRRVLEHGYRLRPMAMDRFEAEMEIIYRLSTEIFADNFLYEAISLDDFLGLYRPARSLIDPQLVLIAETAMGEPVGFVFALVDYHQAVAAMRGGEGPLAKLRFLMHRRHADAVNIKSLGVVPGHRRSGLAAALTCQIYQTMVQKGFRRANLCLIREGNPSGRLDGEVGTVSRRYVLYHYLNERA